MEAVWIGAFATALLGSAAGSLALPSLPAPKPAVTGSSAPLLLIRHHHHGHWRHRHSHWPDGDDPEATPGTAIDTPYGNGISGSNPPPPSASSPTAAAPAQSPANRATRDASRPSIRWVDPEKSTR